MTHLFPELVFSHSIQDIEHSLNVFLSALRRLSPSGKSDPVIGLLTPGCYNSAYFEHTLAQQMGIQLVEGHDLVVIDHKVYIRGIKGLRQIDVLYRRIDDDFLDPLAFDPSSMLGVAGIMNAYRAGNINIVNAPGTGVADDKAIYAYVPDMVRYYLNEEPILKNVPTYILSRPEEREHVLQHLDEMVVKETSLSGGYGMLIGPSATEREIADFRLKILADPDRYIAQPTIQLSRAPVMMDGQMAARHIDLRAFVIAGDNIQVIPGGLTRVARKKVHSSSTPRKAEAARTLGSLIPKERLEARGIWSLWDEQTEALFWIGRYAERTENHARLIDVYYHIREEKESTNGQSWSRLIDTIGDRAAFIEQYGKAPPSSMSCNI